MTPAGTQKRDVIVVNNERRTVMSVQGDDSKYLDVEVTPQGVAVTLDGILTYFGDPEEIHFLRVGLMATLDAMKGL